MPMMLGTRSPKLGFGLYHWARHMQPISTTRIATSRYLREGSYAGQSASRRNTARCATSVNAVTMRTGFDTASS